MAEKHKGNGHKTETPDVSHIRNVEVTHETSDVNVMGVLMFVVVLTVATAAVSVGMWLLFRQTSPVATRAAPSVGPRIPNHAGGRPKSKSGKGCATS